MREGIPIYVVVFLFFTMFMKWLGVPEDVSAYVSASLLLMMYYASSLNFPVHQWEFRDEVVKPFLLTVDEAKIYEEVRLNFRSSTEVLINAVGTLTPLAMSIVGGFVAVTALGASIWDVVTLTSFLTFVYARITQAIRGKGLGVPLAKVVGITVVASLAITCGITPKAAALVTYASTVLATLIGIDLLNLRKVAIFRSKKVIIGGMGVTDAIFFLPALTALLVWSFASVLACAH
ncbi:MAG: DUF1614 domain-containing protein [Desulfurococcales archaeon]|nr:DUF1614 domain-containing protein [Desulfurococcales archaeon]